MLGVTVRGREDSGALPRLPGRRAPKEVSFSSGIGPTLARPTQRVPPRRADLAIADGPVNPPETSESGLNTRPKSRTMRAKQKKRSRLNEGAQKSSDLRER